MSSSRPRRNRWGTIFLLAALVGFIVFTVWGANVPGWGRYARAFFEASLVGALADWFAVTALFRRPLGLPLPHTDLLVRRKDQLVEALPQFLATFLEPARVGPVLKQVDWVGLALEHFDPTQLDDLFDRGVVALEASPGRDAWERRAVTAGASLLWVELDRHRDGLVDPVTTLIKKNAGWKGLFVGRDTVDEAIGGLLAEVAAVRDDPAHPLRPGLRRAVAEAWPRLARELQPSKWTQATWEQLQDDPKFRADLNQKAGDLAARLWEQSRASQTLASGLRYLLAQTDARELARRIEGAVGNDLQYIRVNGALVGGLAGLGLALLTNLT